MTKHLTHHYKTSRYPANPDAPPVEETQPWWFYLLYTIIIGGTATQLLLPYTAEQFSLLIAELIAGLFFSVGVLLDLSGAVVLRVEAWVTGWFTNTQMWGLVVPSILLLLILSNSDRAHR